MLALKACREPFLSLQQRTVHTYHDKLLFSNPPMCHVSVGRLGVARAGKVKPSLALFRKVADGRTTYHSMVYSTVPWRCCFENIFFCSRFRLL